MRGDLSFGWGDLRSRCFPRTPPPLNRHPFSPVLRRAGGRHGPQSKATHPWNVGGEPRSIPKRFYKRNWGAATWERRRRGGKETDCGAGDPGVGGKELSSSLNGLAPRERSATCCIGTGPAEGEKPQRAYRCLRGQWDLSPNACGAPPWEALATDTLMRDADRKKGGGGRLEPVWPAPAVSHSHLILVYRLHQLAPRVEVGASPKTGAPALQQTSGHLRHGRSPPRPLPPLPPGKAGL